MGILTPLLNTFRRSNRPVQVEAPPDSSATPALRRRACDLADAIDAALDRGQLPHAERLASSAHRLLPIAPRLVEPIARLRLAQGEPLLALDLIDTHGPTRDGRRLLRCLCLLQLGRTGDAETELTQWTRRSSAPLPARRLLALLRWSMHDNEGAMRLLLRNLRQLEDPSTLSTIFALSVARGRDELAGRWAQRLRQHIVTHPDDTMVRLLLDALGHHRADEGWPSASEAQVEHLAQELIAQPNVIPALALGCTLQQTTEQRIDLLIRAIERAQPELPLNAGATRALTTLHQVRENMIASFAWSTDDMAETSTIDPLDEAHPVLATIHPDDDSNDIRGQAA